MNRYDYDIMGEDVAGPLRKNSVEHSVDESFNDLSAAKKALIVEIVKNGKNMDSIQAVVVGPEPEPVPVPEVDAKMLKTSKTKA